MPFVSESQRKYLYSQKPEVAKKFAQHSGKSVQAKPDAKEFRSHRNSQGVALPSKVTQPVRGTNK